MNNLNPNFYMSVHYLFQHVKDRVSRMQSENSFSNFAEAKPIFEATPQRTLVEPFRRCKGRTFSGCTQ